MTKRPSYRLLDWDNTTDDDEVSTIWWLTIVDSDGEEMAVVICRDFERIQREHPEWVTRKEAGARLIVHALNQLEKGMR